MTICVLANVVRAVAPTVFTPCSVRASVCLAVRFTGLYGERTGPAYVVKTLRRQVWALWVVTFMPITPPEAFHPGGVAVVHLANMGGARHSVHAPCDRASVDPTEMTPSLDLGFGAVQRGAGVLRAVLTVLHTSGGGALMYWAVLRRPCGGLPAIFSRAFMRPTIIRVRTCSIPAPIVVAISGIGVFCPGALESSTLVLMKRLETTGGVKRFALDHPLFIF